MTYRHHELDCHGWRALGTSRGEGREGWWSGWCGRRKKELVLVLEKHSLAQPPSNRSSQEGTGRGLSWKPHTLLATTLLPLNPSPQLPAIMPPRLDLVAVSNHRHSSHWTLPPPPALTQTWTTASQVTLPRWAATSQS